MKVTVGDVKSVGLSLLYEPDWPTDPAVDIVFVHGIGGHPVRTWRLQSDDDEAITTPKVTVPYPGLKRRLTKKLPPSTPLHRSNSEPLTGKTPRPQSRARTLLWGNSTKSSSRLDLNGSSNIPEPSSLGRSRTVLRKSSLKNIQKPLPDLPIDIFTPPPSPKVGVYWPLDLLPTSCPNARIFTWGYHTLVKDGKPVRQQGDIFAQAEEFLIDLAVLCANTPPQLLRKSEAERDGPLKQVLLCTSAVLFLGSPHRGTEHCKLSDAIRSMASVTLRGSDPDDPVLAALAGAKGAEAELGRQAFVRLWNDYNFGVKTFQESVMPSYRVPELRAETTIRRLASFIGDPREGAETIAALHDGICRFGSAEDQGYRAVMRALEAFISAEEDGRHVLTLKETECVSALAPLQESLPDVLPATTYPGTCLWLYDLPDFQAWHHRSGPSKHKILWIRGAPGSGKSVLVKSLRKRLERQWGPAGASFICVTAESHGGLKDPYPTQEDSQVPRLAGLYRSLLAQLFPHDPALRKALLALYKQPRDDPRSFDDAQVVSFFADYYVNQKLRTPTRRAFIFIEVADDACPAYVHELLGRLSHLAHNSDFSICVASGYHPEIIEEENVISVPMQLRNADDVLRYVNLNLVAEWEERNKTVIRIGQKAGGVFLWAEIVVNILNAAIIEGATEEMIEYTLEEVPGDLYGLYEWMLSTMNERERAESLVLFQWAMLSAEPMRLNDLFMAIRLTEPNPFALFEQRGPLMAFDVGTPFSIRDLRQLRNSEISSDTPYQFHRWLRARSIGLLELKSDNHHHHSQPSSEPLGLQRVYPIHSSVRNFFLSGRGFACLAAGNPFIPSTLPISDFFDITHYTLLRACLTYLNMRDFESIGHGARRRRKVPVVPSPTTTNSDSSTSSYSTHTSPFSPPTQNSHYYNDHYHNDHLPIQPHPLKPSPPLPPHHTHHPLLPTTISTQRHLVMSSYPFLHYAVTHLLHHLLAPQPFRYFLPQHELLAALAANKFRLWKRWTSLLGTYEPDVILRVHAAGAQAGGVNATMGNAASGVAHFLSPVYGARYRLERVLRKLFKLAASESYVSRRRGAREPEVGGYGADVAWAISRWGKRDWVGCVMGVVLGGHNRQKVGPSQLFSGLPNANPSSHATFNVLSQPRDCRPHHTLIPMLALATHARRTVLLRATHPKLLLDVRWASTVSAAGEPELKKELDRDGTWLAARRLKQGGNRDIYRVNLISDQLARDTLKYMGPTLKRHEGCDLLDIFPGPGIWSKRLHDVVKPRSHILMEPDAEFYKPYLEPLLEKPGTQLLPESGIVWEQLNKVLNPTVLPHQVERKYTPEETPERNDTLLVTMNLAMSPRRKFRSFESLAQLVMFQMLSSIRPGSLFQKYGLVRMLIWAEDADTKAILPRTIQARKKLAIEAELSTDWVTQLVSPDAPRPTAAGASRWYLRSESLNLESARRALVRMQDQGFKLIRGREPEHVREFFDFVDPDKSAGPKNQFTRKGRPGDIELVQLQKEWDDGTIQEGSKEHKRLSHLVHLQTFDSRRAVVTERLMREHDAIVRDYVKAGDDEAKQQEVLARAKAWTDTINKFEKKTRNEIVLLRDNRHVVKQDKPFMNWDRRYIEPLRAEPQEFFPAAPCVLLDIQPRAVPSILREIGPTSSRGGDMFELLLRGLVQHILDPVDGCMNTITPGAGDWVVPHCKTMHDPTVGGHVPGLLWPSTRTLSTDHLVELTEQWMKWPFRPSYEQLVSRTIEEADAEPGEDGREANKLKLPMEL
ncbi:uncharacterized protein C8A04DRAFT_9624 [Dichotomopilus funicola]|uniref:Nephrocystin 3-like N-terminal domain-containing protein n=1 Tax=Dichotomopilus funicola TaxID=1934379 RepID=A0AAN6ZQU8_9PEZI|nr:hypothetical protein C8A04DRAFT_9624 [Dichotomopilus funicola]